MIIFFAVLIYVVSFLIFYIYSKVFNDEYDLSEYLKITTIIYAVVLVIYFEVLFIVLVITYMTNLNEFQDAFILSIIGVILYGGLSFAAIYWILKDTVPFMRERIIITATYIGVTIVILLINTQNMIYV